jgi:uncharacterized protein (TIGR00369 family)
LQDFGDCIQSSQIGPHLVQPLSRSPRATTLKISAKRLNISPIPATPLSYGPKSGIFKPGGLRAVFGRTHTGSTNGTIPGKERPFMQHDQQPAAEFGITEARRVLGDVFAPWVQDLGLSVSRIEFAPPPGAAADWQPGAILRMAFSERLCRHGGIICGQALMALADTAMVMAILAANRGYRPMTTVDQTTHFMRAVTSSDVIADARVVRLGRTMSFGRVTLSSAVDNKPAAMVASAFAML